MSGIHFILDLLSDWPLIVLLSLTILGIRWIPDRLRRLPSARLKGDSPKADLWYSGLRSRWKDAQERKV